jgi:hypothetical protein
MKGVLMRRYRFCLFDQFDEALLAEVFECADDSAAGQFLSQQLSKFPDAHYVELWELNRLILAGAVPSLDANPSKDRCIAVQRSRACGHLNLSAERLRDAYSYWRGKRGGRLMPCRSDMDPIEIPRLLPYVMLIDVLAGPLDFRYRLIGTAVRSISRRDYTGLLFSELPGKGKDSALWQGCEAVVHSKRPHSHSLPYVGGDVFVRNCENVLLPLSDDRVNVTMILKVISFDYVPSAQAAS